MTTTRRGFMAAAGAFAGLGLLPSWRAFKQRRQIDLTPFCDTDCRYSRYAISQPFAQERMVYATDARIMCRTTLADAPELAEGARLPAASKIQYWEDGDLRWQPWPKLNLFSDNSRWSDTCPKCFGKGVFGNVRQCATCDGDGDIPVDIDTFDVDLHTVPCKLCCESGYMGDVRCDYCDGSGQTRKPAIQRIGSVVVAGHYDTRVRALGDVEYAITELECTANKYMPPLVKFRGDGFEGLLVTLDMEARHP